MQISRNMPRYKGSAPELRAQNEIVELKIKTRFSSHFIGKLKANTRRLGPIYKGLLGA